MPRAADDAPKIRFAPLAVVAFGVVGVLAAVPLALSLNRGLLRDAEISTATVVVTQIVQGSFLITLATVAGFMLGPRIGLSTPVWPNRIEIVRAVWIGAICSLLIVIIDVAVFVPRMRGVLEDVADVPDWQRFLASLYGGITEEVLVRLGLLTFIAWTGMRITRKHGTMTTGVFWAANGVSAVLFGLGHLPITQSVVDITALVVTRAVLLNGALGLVFGWIYRDRGLAPAIAAHFSADIVIQTSLSVVG